MAWKNIDDFDLAGKTVVTRVDLNVPVKNGKVTDATRIARIVPTLRDILAKGARVVLLAHFGRPEGKPDPALSLRIVLPDLEAALGREVVFMERPDRSLIDALPAGAVVLAENTRFTAMEEANDPRLARFLAGLGDVYCNDAFSAAHRAHASTEGVAHLLPAFAGRLMEAELRALEKALTDPARPVMAIVGGAKISTKLDLLGNLIRKVDRLVIGGAMANTFLGAQGLPVGKSLCEHDLFGTALDILRQAEDVGCELVLPLDVVVAKALKEGATTRVLRPDEVGADDLILDAGPASVARITDLMESARTLVWNGPLGAFETPPFDAATRAAARRAAELTESGRLLSVAGGGDTVAALNAAGVTEAFSYVSTAGGAFLEWLEGKTLPGVAALES